MGSQNIPGRKLDKLQLWLSLRGKRTWELRKEEIGMFTLSHIHLFILCVYGSITRGQFARVGPLLSCGSWGWNSSSQAWQQATWVYWAISVPKISAEDKTHIQKRHWTEPQCLWMEPNSFLGKSHCREIGWGLVRATSITKIKEMPTGCLKKTNGEKGKWTEPRPWRYGKPSAVLNLKSNGIPKKISLVDPEPPSKITLRNYSLFRVWAHPQGPIFFPVNFAHFLKCLRDSRTYLNCVFILL